MIEDEPITNEDEFLLDGYKQEEILKKIRDYSEQLAKITNRILNTGAYYANDGSRIDELSDLIAKENKTLYCHYELKRGELDE
ncbi:MAG: hypothetical protein IJF84_13480 [Thermoguttaceae bacterium]|nr:hypothetical protein [Thermoguttaceae bacterium]